MYDSISEEAFQATQKKILDEAAKRNAVKSPFLRPSKLSVLRSVLERSTKSLVVFKNAEVKNDGMFLVRNVERLVKNRATK